MTSVYWASERRGTGSSGSPVGDRVSQSIEEFPDRHGLHQAGQPDRFALGGHLLDPAGGGVGRRVVASTEHSCDFRIAVVGQSAGEARHQSAAQRDAGASIPAGQIALGGVGLYRIVLLDGTSGVVTYGDVEVTG